MTGGIMTTRKPVGDRSGKFDYTLKKQGGGPGQYARVIGQLEACDELFIFENRVVGGAIPSKFISACEQGFRDAANSGILAGYPVIGVKVILESGDYHPVDSNDYAFRFAASQAFYQGLETSDPLIIEPVMLLTVEVPSKFIGAVQSDLLSLRAVLTGLEYVDNSVILVSQVPLAQMFGYATRLRSLCSGGSQFSMSFSHYQPVPKAVEQKLIVGASK
ncbi:MAG: hypothetical protein U7127_30645 (plasmid) [Phormidium sp.]